MDEVRIIKKDERWALAERVLSDGSTAWEIWGQGDCYEQTGEGFVLYLTALTRADAEAFFEALTNNVSSCIMETCLD